MREMQRKMPHTRMSFAVTKDMKNQLDKMAVKLEVPTSELVRRYVAQGMGIEKTKDDIDFIRRHIREGIDASLNRPILRIVKLLIKIGIPAIAMCHFTSDLLFHFMKDHSNIKKDEILESGKKKAAAYLRVRSELVEEAFEQQLVDDDDY